MEKVEITVENGVAYVDSCPPSVAVQVTDYDVYPEFSDQSDENGRACSRYVVEAAVQTGDSNVG